MNQNPNSTFHFKSVSQKTKPWLNTNCTINKSIATTIIDQFLKKNKWLLLIRAIKRNQWDGEGKSFKNNTGSACYVAEKKIKEELMLVVVCKHSRYEFAVDGSLRCLFSGIERRGGGLDSRVLLLMKNWWCCREDKARMINGFWLEFESMEFLVDILKSIRTIDLVLLW